MLGRWLLIAPAIVLLAAGCSSSGETRVVVAAGTTLVDSQFMAEIAEAYAEVEPLTELSVVALSSAQAISLAEAGDADVMITHSREALDEFLEAHPRSVRYDVFASDFFLVADPEIRLVVDSIEQALSVVADEAHLFVSRDDRSGTHIAELDAWDASGIDPSGQPWYIRTGTGMGSTLQVADQRHGVTLAEHGAYLASESVLSLLRVDNTVIGNPYDLTVVGPEADRAAIAFAEWMTSPDGVVVIQDANLKLFGKQVYATP
ncbi:MAG: substrate-binding domain-containing protein [Actinomycetia bacterium]|nr:substrate-binding domain-containing protein [Actinomycetes bacterium]